MLESAVCGKLTSLENSTPPRINDANHEAVGKKKSPSAPILNFGGEGGIDSSGAAFAALTLEGRSA